MWNWIPQSRNTQREKKSKINTTLPSLSMSRLLMYCYYLTFIIYIQLLRISSGLNCFVASYSQLGTLRTRNRRYHRRFAFSKPSPSPSSSWQDKEIFIRKYASTLCCGKKVEDDIEEEEEEDPVALMIGNDDSTTTTTTTCCIGEVVRLGARKYDSEHSKPSSGRYTTRKDGFTKLEITKIGIKGDYNHYRTIALDSTTDRAVSIVTTDIMTSIQATYGTKFSNQIQDGDLGENILIDGVAFDYFRIGQCYEFITPIENKQQQQQQQQQQRQDDDELQHHVVVIEITEPMTPCANLCKLSYINDETIKPMDRIERCKDFLTYLGRYDGYRGWYGKVQKEGTIGIGATVSLIRSVR